MWFHMRKCVIVLLLWLTIALCGVLRMILFIVLCWFFMLFDVFGVCVFCVVYDYYFVFNKMPDIDIFRFVDISHDMAKLGTCDTHNGSS